MTPEIDRMNNCWNWTKALNKDGYGQVWFRGKLWRAHRAAWFLAYGKIPRNLHIMHDCDNRKCFNPDHLSLGTHKENMQQRDSRNIGYQAFGENHGNVKFSKKEILEIRQEYSKGNTSYRKLAKIYNTNPSYIGHIIRKKWWKHI